jgi:serine/threonine-protein kinase
MAEGFPQAAAVFRPGSTVGGYLLEEQIGQGGMAVVFRALDERLKRTVALKILAPALAGDEAFRQRFIRESRTAASVDDPHIIPVYEAGDKDGVLFIAMRYVGGGDVRTLINRESPLDPSRVAAIVSPAASALDAAHAAGLVHRDVKPANMLLDVRPGRPDHVYLSDFGLSKTALGSTGLTHAGQVLGTVDYAAPEQLSGKQVDGRADQYALGCAAFEMLTGEPPFTRDQPLAVIYAHLSEPPPTISGQRPGLPAALDDVFKRVLAKDPQERYPTCTDFARALREASGQAPYDPAPSPPRPATEVVPHAPAARITADDATVGAGVLGAAGQFAGPAQYGGPAQYAGTPYIPGLYPPGGQGPGQYGPPPAAPYGASGPYARETKPQARRWPAVVVSAVILVAAGAIAYVVLTFSGHSPATSNANGSPTTGTSSGLGGGSPSPSTGSGSPATQPSSPGGSPANAWTTYSDPSGFSIELPPGWSESSADRSGDYPVVDFAGPDPGYILLVSWSRITGPSALGAWQELAAMRAQDQPTYHQIRLENVYYRGYDAAVWEFTEVDNGVLWHYNDWGFVTKPGIQGYAIELKGPQTEWTSVYGGTWNRVLSTFKPAS